MSRDIQQLLKTHEFTKGLNDEQLSFIAGCAKNVIFQPGAYIFREGDAADQFYLVRHGTVALEMEVPGQGPTTIRTLKDNDELGVSWLIPPYRWSFDARAVTLTRAIGFDAACLRGKCEEDHELGYRLMMRFAPRLWERLRSARLQLADVYGKPGG
jgi:CRP/FNR family transcriptional regulator, cyclic AMP receptor protein